jgi:hypothetical protein|nr:MAG TPA: hypothetical protein [Caudoviricetes sp.]
MILQLKNNIYEYLNDKEVVVPDGYDKISDEYPFYYFLEDFIGSNSAELEEDDRVGFIVDEIYDLAITMEPMLDTTVMDNRLRKLHEELIKVT